MESFSAIIDAFGLARFRDALGISDHHARMMKQRDSIPPEWWEKVVDEGKKRRLGITHALLARLRSKRFNGEAAA